ncbi:MAG: anhydro-N-acetylmuramic acid kinase [Gammaproteobacteria bacterium]|nr:anhydro-N-acetylmuramic acid kinase [Gammaproteobacteria bacterium]
MDELYVGLMSGTSLNGVDAVLVALGGDRISLQHHHSEPFPQVLYESLQQLITTQQTSLSQLADIDHQLAVVYSLAVNKLLEDAGIPATTIKAIGCHGQTIYHQPEGAHRNSLQLGDASYIAEITGIPVIADLRRRDMAAGGQGAPMVPAFHAAAFRSTQCDRVIANIGGIANITILPRDTRSPVTGFDTGPGNTLSDQWIRQQRHTPFDTNGDWAASGQIIQPVLNKLLADPYFDKAPPKSTGREYFNLPWLEQHVETAAYAPEDMQATLAELTSQTIATAIQQYATEATEIFVCGGGAHNAHIMLRLSQLLTTASVQSTRTLGVEPDWVEAAAFAWLAKQTLHKQAGNLPSVTGAKRSVILGGVYQTED